jgi:hypothetical protein
MEKIILKNWENSKGFKDYFDQSIEFDIDNQLAYTYGDNVVSPLTAHRIGFEIADNFKLPGSVHNRVECAEYVQGTLGINRQKNPKLYFQTWAKLAESLPRGTTPNIGQNRNNNDK